MPTVQLSFRLREDEAAMLRTACKGMGISPGRLIGRMIRATFEPVTVESSPVAPKSLEARPEEA